MIQLPEKFVWMSSRGRHDSKEVFVGAANIRPEINDAMRIVTEYSVVNGRRPRIHTTLDALNSIVDVMNALKNQGLYARGGPE